MKLVYVGKVIEVINIPEADKIESLEVVCGTGGIWRGCALKNQFQVGDRCTVFLQDSLLPETDEFEFMKKHKYRVRMCRFLGTPSEVLIMPYKFGDVGDDVTEEFKVTKYEKAISVQMMGLVKGNFPSFIPKTDEPNFQTSKKLVYFLHGQKVNITEKCDGTSCTIYFCGGVFGVCSRNMELKEGDNIYWKMAKKYKIEESFRLFGNNINWNVALQMEIVGPGIQKNPMKLKENEIRLFSVWDLDRKKYVEIDSYALLFNIPTVRYLHKNVVFNYTTNDALREMAAGNYKSGSKREGIVIRPVQEQILNGARVSFKVINLEYKG